MTEATKYLYRYSDVRSKDPLGEKGESFREDGDDYGETLFVLISYRIAKKTPAGYWIFVNHQWEPPKKRFVKMGTTRQFAHPTKEEALRDYLRRKSYHLAKVSYYQDYLRRCMETAQKLQGEKK